MNNQLLKPILLNSPNNSDNSLNVINLNLSIVDKNITTPSSDTVINNPLFKYEEKYIKQRLIDEDIADRRFNEKAANIINFLNGFKNKNYSDLKSMDILNSLEHQISANMLQKIDQVFDEEYIQIKNEINSLQKLLTSLTESLSSLKNPMIKLTTKSWIEYIL